ncbi:MAG: GNAT family N-acetyltransferase, partial [Armatimonadota bacterium]|nr:GNAT family N-acetyltransferase [Armatimonadota bacterium]
MISVTNELGQPVGVSLNGWSPPPLPGREPMTGRFCRLEPLQAALQASTLYDADLEDTDGRSWTYLPYGPFETFRS